MHHLVGGPNGGINLQATLSASSACSSDELIKGIPHHPITCTTELEVDFEAGEFRCQHAGVPLGELRTQYCVDHSIALLLIELAVKKFG